MEGIAIIIQLLGAAYFAKQQMGLMKGSIVGRGYEIWVMVALSFAVCICALVEWRGWCADDVVAACYSFGIVDWC